MTVLQRLRRGPERPTGRAAQTAQLGGDERTVAGSPAEHAEHASRVGNDRHDGYNGHDGRVRRGQARRPRVHTVFERTLHDQRYGLLGWIVGIALLATWLLAMYPSIKGNEEMTKLLESYPEAFRTLFNLDDFTSGPGYLRSEVFSFTMPVLLTVLAVFWGADAIAGEEERHTLDLLLANPVSRRRVVAEKWASVVVAVTAVTAGLGVVLALGGPAVGLDISLARLAAPVVASALLAIVFAALAFAVGAATGHRGLARGVGVVAAVGAYLVSSLADLVTWLKPLRPLSPWYHALGVDPIGSGLQVGHIAVLVALALLLWGTATAGFERRDLAR